VSLACDYAGDLLKQLKIQSLPIDPYDICERARIVVKEDDCEGYTGMLLVVGKEALISVKSSIREQSRKRFTVAHELGQRPRYL
jgi:Zn-dependent peptidase ImmA (M78 family)